MKTIAIIPARGGSKRIERKNVKEFAGVPVIAYSIRAALRAGCFDEVMVSTDDKEIAEVARRWGASVPFMRSAETANDFATTADVIAEVLNGYKAQGREFDTLACIYATAPFVTAERLREAAAIIERGEAQAAFTCVEYSYPTQRCLVIGPEGRIGMKYPEYAKARSQDLQKTYHDAGQFYFSTVRAFESCGSLWGPDTRPIILPELEVQDLDTPVDWRLAEMKYEMLSLPGRFSTAHYEFIPYTEIDAEMSRRMLEGRNEPEVRRQMAGRETISEQEHLNFIEDLRTRRDKRYYAVTDLDGNAIGSVNLEWTGTDSVERGIWLAADARGKGHASRMLRELYAHIRDTRGVRGVTSYVRIDNEASSMLEQALGSRETRRDDQYVYYELSL